MTNLESLRSLQKRIREATGPDREIDLEICKVFGIFKSVMKRLDAQGSLTADNLGAAPFTLDPDGLGPCMWLLEAVFPGAEFDLNTLYGLAHVNLPLNAAEHETIQYVRREDGNKCLAFCEAIISALIAQEEAKEKADV